MKEGNTDEGVWNKTSDIQNLEKHHRNILWYHSVVINITVLCDCEQFSIGRHLLDFLYQNVVSSCTLNRTRRNSLPSVNASDVKTSHQNNQFKQTFFSVTVTEQVFPITSPQRLNWRWFLLCWVHDHRLVNNPFYTVESVVEPCLTGLVWKQRRLCSLIDGEGKHVRNHSLITRKWLLDGLVLSFS